MTNTIRRIVGIAVCVLGAAAVTLGVLSATVWRTSNVVVATAPGQDVPYVVIEPGVAGIVDQQVTIDAVAADPEAQVVLVVGREPDVNGWVEGDPTERIVNMESWTDMAWTVDEVVVDEPAEGEEQAEPSYPSPLGSDMWTRTETGTGSVSMSWTVPNDRTSVLIYAGDGTGSAPTVSFTWDHSFSTPYLWPLVVAGSVALLVGILFLVAPVMRRGGRAEREEPEETEDESASGQGAEETLVLGAVDAAHPPLTRRQLREMRESGVLSAVDANGAAPALEEGQTQVLAPVGEPEQEPVEPEPVAMPAGSLRDERVPVAADTPEGYPDWMRAQASPPALAPAVLPAPVPAVPVPVPAPAPARASKPADEDYDPGPVWTSRWGLLGQDEKRWP